MVRLRVKEVAQEKGFSMGRLSRESNIAFNTIREIYRNPYRQITVVTLDKLARTLGVTTDELIEHIDDKEGRPTD